MTRVDAILLGMVLALTIQVRRLIRVALRHDVELGRWRVHYHNGALMGPVWREGAAR